MNDYKPLAELLRRQVAVLDAQAIAFAGRPEAGQIDRTVAGMRRMLEAVERAALGEAEARDAAKRAAAEIVAWARTAATGTPQRAAAHVIRPLADVAAHLARARGR